MQIKSYTQLLKDSWTELNKDFQTYLLIALVAGAGFYWNLLMDIVGMKSGITELIAAALYIIFGIMALLAILSKVNNKDKQLTFSESFAIAKQSFGKVLGTYLLVLLIVILGFIAFIIPGIVLVVMFAFVVPVALFEGKYYTDAAKASYEYVKGYWLKVFGRILFIAIVIGVPISLIGVFLNQAIGAKQSTHIQDFLSILAIPLVVIFDYLLYKELVAAKASSNPAVQSSLPQAEVNNNSSNESAQHQDRDNYNA